AVASAFALSVLLSDPKLADTESIVMLPRLPIAAVQEQRTNTEIQKPSAVAARKDPEHVMRFEDVVNRQPQMPNAYRIFGDSNPSGPSDPGIGNGPGIGVIGGIIENTGAPPAPAPNPPQPRPVAQTTPPDNRPLRIPSTVLQGKAIQKVVPVYPQIPKQIRLQGDVSVEVIISPEGLVESVRVVSGHPMLAQAAVNAARGWRFQPTLLNNVPVRVTGVITFAFKINE